MLMNPGSNACTTDVMDYGPRKTNLNRSLTAPSGSAAVTGGHRSVFRVSVPRRTRKKIIQSVPPRRKEKTEVRDDDREEEPNDGGSEPVYHARRPHRKSRRGCANCKKRRIKCDETRPHCKRCELYGVTCDFTALSPWSNRSRGLASEFLEALSRYSSPDAAGFRMSLTATAEKLDELLQNGSPIGSGSRLISTRTSLPSCLQALHHFSNFTVHTISSPSSRAILQKEVMELAFERPYLMHGVMAVATTHLCRIVPDNSTYKVAEAYHWQQAISQYSREIQMGVGLHNMDPLFATCMLSSVLLFSTEDYKPANSWLFQPGRNQEALNWLVLQCGLRHLLGLTQGLLHQSMWFDMFMETHNHNGSFDVYDDHRLGRDGLPPDLCDLCGIDETTSEDTSPYHWPLRMLAPLLQLELSIHSFQIYTTFMGRLLPDYLDLLLEKDPAALIILSWWLALMCSVKLWWFEPRVRAECTAICMYLEDHPDPRILPLLKFPADACGYVLSPARRRALLEASSGVLYTDNPAVLRLEGLYDSSYESEALSL